MFALISSKKEIKNTKNQKRLQKNKYFFNNWNKRLHEEKDNNKYNIFVPFSRFFGRNSLFEKNMKQNFNSRIKWKIFKLKHKIKLKFRIKSNKPFLR